MPDLGRWMNIDPLAEKYFSMSPYVYAANIPTRFVDYDGRDFGISFENGVITITQTWYNDGTERTIDFLNKAVEYLMSISGDYGVETKDGEIIPISFAINVSNKKGVDVDTGFLIENSNQLLAARDDTANFISEVGLELRNTTENPFTKEAAIAAAMDGGDDTKFCQCARYSDKDKDMWNADAEVVRHEIFHTLGISHRAIGDNGVELNLDAIGGMLQYASKNARGVKIKLSNVKSGSFETQTAKQHRPKVVKTSKKRIKIRGTVVKIN